MTVSKDVPKSKPFFVGILKMKYLKLPSKLYSTDTEQIKSCVPASKNMHISEKEAEEHAANVLRMFELINNENETQTRELLM